MFWNVPFDHYAKWCGRHQIDVLAQTVKKKVLNVAGATTVITWIKASKDSE